MSTLDYDISPLIHYLWLHKLISESNHLGIVQFGTEEFHSTSNVTFSAKEFNLSVAAGQPQVASRSSDSMLPNLGLVLISLLIILASL